VSTTKWKSQKNCKCGGNILAVCTMLSPKQSYYSFECDKCEKKGSWDMLARVYLGDNKSDQSFTKKKVANKKSRKVYR
jgi:hypothetical protein